MILYTAPEQHAPTSSGAALAKNQMSMNLSVSPRRAGPLALGVALLLACAGATGAVAQDKPATEPAPQEQAVQERTAPAMQEMALGNPDAPVTVVEYASLTCPHCATFHTQVLPELKAEYIDTGKVRLVFRDFPLDRFALSAAMLARCSGPEKYFPFLEMLFKQQQKWIGSGAPDEVMDNLSRLARLAGMDDAAVAACLKDEALSEYILTERLNGNKEFDIQSTPTLVIDGKAYPGVRRIDELRTIIDPLLPADMKESRLQQKEEGSGTGPG